MRPRRPSSGAANALSDADAPVSEPDSAAPAAALAARSRAAATKPSTSTKATDMTTDPLDCLAGATCLANAVVDVPAIRLGALVWSAGEVVQEDHHGLP